MIRGFWAHVFHTAASLTNIIVPLTEENALFGIIKENHMELQQRIINIYNHVILIGKMCISKFRYGKIKNVHVIFEADFSLRNKFLAL